MDKIVQIILSPSYGERIFSHVSVVVSFQRHDFNWAVKMAVNRVKKTYPPNTVFDVVCINVI